MKNSGPHFWPFQPKVSIIFTIILLIVLLIINGILKTTVGWPPDSSTNTVLIGILLISLLPVVLAILDVVIDKGATIGYGEFKIDFSKVERKGISDIIVPANIGVRGQVVTDSGTLNILDALRESSTSSIVIVDLEDGQAWWETRLLVLVSGAVRLGRPDNFIFVATKSGKPISFIGWAKARNLLACLLKINSKYARCYAVAKAIASQWQLVPPVYPPAATPLIAQIPNPLIWMQGEVSSKQWMAFDPSNGLPSEFFEEQILQNELGREIEVIEGGKVISISRLSDLFESVLKRDYIDKDSTPKEQMEGYFEDDEPFIAITENGRYISLVSRFAVYNEVFKNITSKMNDE
ncbi:MAG: hypothetical protein C5B59_18410 [Bacteroidetes bacterium]|nr:MAG: hypothetical protein C5B59_18410 [Bacteroidota bacterium]